MTNLFLGEFIGTALLILLGNGVVANVVLLRTKGEGSGWIAITMGWGLAVFVAVFVVSGFSNAHINPAVSLGLALAGKLPWSEVPLHLLAQFLGGALGAFLVWVHYKDHYDATESGDAKLATFSTGPAIRNGLCNLYSEIIATFVLVFAVLHISSPEGGLGSLDALPVALVVLVIGLCLGGTTGYSINPARDLSPRIMHAILPIRGKINSDWNYAWIPVMGPFLGGLAAGALYLLMT